MIDHTHQKARQNPGHKALDKGEKGIDVEQDHAHGAAAADAETLQKARHAKHTAENRTAHRPQRGGTDGHRDHIEADRQGADVQIPQGGHAKDHQNRSQQTQKCGLPGTISSFHRNSSLLSFLPSEDTTHFHYITKSEKIHIFFSGVVLQYNENVPCN